jgi:hypothetical protein
MASSATDDYYGDDGFDNYIPKTVDPGPWMLIGVCLYSIFCVILLPILVVIGQKLDDRKLDRKAWEEVDDSTPDEASVGSNEEGIEIPVIDLSRSLEFEANKSSRILDRSPKQQQMKIKALSSKHRVSEKRVSILILIFD